MDSAHSPHGPKIVGSRLALRRHLVLVHQSDFKVSYDGSGRQFDKVVLLSGDDLSKKTDTFRRAGRHRDKAATESGLTTSVTADMEPFADSEIVHSTAVVMPPVSAEIAIASELPVWADFSLGQDMSVLLDIRAASDTAFQNDSRAARAPSAPAAA